MKMSLERPWKMFWRFRNNLPVNSLQHLNKYPYALQDIKVENKPVDIQNINLLFSCQIEKNKTKKTMLLYL